MTGMDVPLDSPDLTRICEQSDVAYLGVFGSYARGDHRLDSDIDLLDRIRGLKGQHQGAEGFR